MSEPGKLGKEPGRDGRFIISKRVSLRYIYLTVPFRTPVLRAKHFERHGREFGAADEFEYERMADTFMSCPIMPTMIEVIRSNPPHDRLRLDYHTRHFGVEAYDFYIRTFMVKDATNIAYHGGPRAFMMHKRTEVSI